MIKLQSLGLFAMPWLIGMQRDELLKFYKMFES